MAPINAQNAWERISNGAVVLDARGKRPEQLIGNATWVDRSRLNELFATPGSEHLIDLGPADQDIVVYCGGETGARAVADHLREQGYTNVNHVLGGFSALAAQSEHDEP